MIGSASGNRVSITGLGSSVPERVVTNAELAEFVDTTDEWIVARTGIRERRVAGPDVRPDRNLSILKSVQQRAPIANWTQLRQTRPTCPRIVNGD